MKKGIVGLGVLLAMSAIFSASVFASNGGFVVASNGGSVVIENETVTPYATEEVDGGLGTWYWGTGVDFLLNKTVYSNLDHGSKVHKSSCSVSNGTSDDSGWVDARIQSKSSAKGR
jgi:hypothetical protein